MLRPMGLTDIVMGVAGEKLIGELASKFSLDGSSVKSALESMIPDFAKGVLGKSEEKSTWITDFVHATQKGLHDKYIDAPETLAEEATTEDGNKILGHVLGSKDASREVARKAADKSGIDYGTLKKMLPVVAAATMGGLSKSGVGKQLAGAIGSDDIGALLKKLM